MPDQRVIPSPTLPRVEIDARLRALGHVPASIRAFEAERSRASEAPASSGGKARAGKQF